MRKELAKGDEAEVFLKDRTDKEWDGYLTGGDPTWEEYGFSKFEGDEVADIAPRVPGEICRCARIEK